MNLLKYRGGLTQQEFADFLGLSQSFYNQLERGTKDPSLKTIRQIAERLGITVGELIGDKVSRTDLPKQHVEN